MPKGENMDESEKKYLEERENFYLQDSIKNKANMNLTG